MVPMSLGNSATNLVGNALGAGDARQARVANALALVCILVISSIIGVAVIAFQDRLGSAFISDPKFVGLFKQICVPMAPFLVLDSVQTVLEGTLRGIGLQ